MKGSQTQNLSTDIKDLKIQRLPFKKGCKIIKTTAREKMKLKNKLCEIIQSDLLFSLLDLFGYFLSCLDSKLIKH
ncbi:CLUMA_CG012303, isoform A [Clunio marinus]|uniref:CLUMA_CG012303, isoform A n=1 Tax=Clunio marinus TaxID=568069 RepID=A0A1J1IED6_9DIPT|nr:CLUMA_CG012303, isoform A [Clunio marinus]